MRKYALMLFISCLNLSLFGQAKQTISKFAVTYKIKHLGFNSTGKFDKLSGEIFFDENHLGSSSITASIETNSFDSDNSMRDNDLKSDKYFDTAHYPKIIMKSISFLHTGGNNYTGEFDLTIKGKTKRVKLPFVYTLEGTRGSFDGSFTINRVDYSIGSSNMMLSNDVGVSIKIETNTEK